MSIVSLSIHSYISLRYQGNFIKKNWMYFAENLSCSPSKFWASIAQDVVNLLSVIVIDFILQIRGAFRLSTTSSTLELVQLFKSGQNLSYTTPHLDLNQT